MAKRFEKEAPRSWRVSSEFSSGISEGQGGLQHGTLVVVRGAPVRICSVGLDAVVEQRPWSLPTKT